MFPAGEAGKGSQWIMRSRQVDSRTSVTDIKFAPKHLGLQLVRPVCRFKFIPMHGESDIDMKVWRLLLAFHC